MTCGMKECGELKWFDVCEMSFGSIELRGWSEGGSSQRDEPGILLDIVCEVLMPSSEVRQGTKPPHCPIRHDQLAPATRVSRTSATCESRQAHALLRTTTCTRSTSEDPANDNALAHIAALPANRDIGPSVMAGAVLWSVLCCFFDVAFFWQRVRSSLPSFLLPVSPHDIS